MDKTWKGAGIGSLSGLILGLVAKKLTNPNKSLSWKDYATWGGVGALVGGGAGAAIAHDPKMNDEDKKRLEQEKKDLENQLEEAGDAGKRLGSATVAAAKVVGGRYAGKLADYAADMASISSGSTAKKFLGNNAGRFKAIRNFFNKSNKVRRKAVGGLKPSKWGGRIGTTLGLLYAAPDIMYAAFGDGTNSTLKDRLLQITEDLKNQ